MTNKEASYAQEHMVAKYMGWKVVSGSGARPFAPGDVIADHFIVECKTHVKECSVQFVKKHWDKIEIEARSKTKFPLLITDDGTQHYKHTWVMIPFFVIANCTVPSIIDGLDDTSRSGNTVIFNHEAAYSLYKQKQVNGSTSMFLTKWGPEGRPLAILPLEVFRQFFEEQFN
jgi:hypothetical protein